MTTEHFRVLLPQGSCFSIVGDVGILSLHSQKMIALKPDGPLALQSRSRVASVD